MKSLLDQADNLTDWHLKEILYLRKINIWKLTFDIMFYEKCPLPGYL